MATLREVAKQAGVSTALVSRVLNKKPGVWASEETRRRIVEVAESLNYTPSASALALSTGRTMHLAVSASDPSLEQGRPSRLWELLGFTDAAGAGNCRVVLMPSSGPKPTPQEYESLIRSNACDGFLLFAEQLSKEILELLRSNDTPFIVVGDPGNDHVPHVDVDNFAYGKQSAQWLAEEGHQRIGLFEFADLVPAKPVPHIARIRAGYEEGLHEAGLSTETVLAPSVRSCSAEQRIALFNEAGRPDALILPGLTDAIVWRATLHSLGLRCPEDVVLLPHLSTMEIPYVEVGLAYHAHDLRALGRRAGSALLRWIEEGVPTTGRVLIPPETPGWRRSNSDPELSSNGDQRG